jgi:predicted dehydrogenase
MKSQTKLRWGILGAARINERLLPAIQQAANAQLIGVASRRPGAAAEILKKYAIDSTGINTYDNPETLLEDDQVQAVYLPMANHEHAEWALRSIEHGKHVLCEKPMALNVNDIDKIKTAALAHKVVVMEGFMYRFHPQYTRVKELIDSGVIGEIRSVRASYSFMMRPARLYRLAEDVSHGGGAMWDIGCYAIHSLRQFFVNPPLSVMAMAKYVESGADISTSGVLDYGDGKFAQFDFSFERARRCEYEIIGSQGGLKCHVVWQLPGDTPVISWWNEDGRQGEEHLLPANHFCLEVEHFSDCVLNNKQPALTLEDARSNCQTIVAALQSAATGRKVEI